MGYREKNDLSAKFTSDSLSMKLKNWRGIDIYI